MEPEDEDPIPDPDTYDGPPEEPDHDNDRADAEQRAEDNARWARYNQLP